jgi:FAD-dependent oxidoreductase family protein
MLTATRQPTRTLDGDVVVAGGGCAGVMAAVAAARHGASVTLVEREGTLGGTSTGVLDTFYGFWAPGADGARMVDGLPGEVVTRLTAVGAAFVRPNTYGAGNGVTYNPEVLRWLYDELCAEAGVRVLLHTSLTAVGDRPSHMLLTSGSELIELDARVAVDASGDAVLAHVAGAASEGFDDVPNSQALTTTFTMAPVDQDAFRAFGRDALLDALGAAVDSGRFDLPRREGSTHVTTAPGVEFVHMTRVTKRDPRDPVALSIAEREGRAQAMEYARFLRDCVPGYETAQIAWMARRIGIRESRRIRGRYWLERADVVGGRRFADAIASGAAPIEEHAAGADTRWEFLGQAYDIPYRSLLPADVDGLLVAGRCFSASHDAHASARNMAQCMAMGQAAGTAAALAVDAAVAPAAVDLAALQRTLRADGAIFGADAPAAVAS